MATVAKPWITALGVILNQHSRGAPSRLCIYDRVGGASSFSLSRERKGFAVENVYALHTYQYVLRVNGIDFQQAGLSINHLPSPAPPPKNEKNKTSDQNQESANVRFPLFLDFLDTRHDKQYGSSMSFVEQWCPLKVFARDRCLAIERIFDNWLVACHSKLALEMLTGQETWTRNKRNELMLVSWGDYIQ